MNKNTTMDNVNDEQILLVVGPYMHDVPMEQIFTKGVLDAEKFLNTLQRKRHEEEAELLRQIFGEQEVEEGSEAHYDKIMKEAQGLFTRQDEVDDPYAFHKAFEKAYAECKEHDMLP